MGCCPAAGMAAPPLQPRSAINAPQALLLMPVRRRRGRQHLGLQGITRGDACSQVPSHCTTARGTGRQTHHQSRSSSRTPMGSITARPMASISSRRCTTRWGSASLWCPPANPRSFCGALLHHLAGPAACLSPSAPLPLLEVSPPFFQVEAFARHAHPTPPEMELLSKAMAAIDSAARGLWPHARTKLFGSQVGE